MSPSSAQVAAYRRTPARRGRDRHTGFRIATRFPFGLFEKSREVAVEGELVIYPAVDPIRLPARDGGRGSGNGTSVNRGSGDDIFALRRMREGDDPRDIYWRKSTSANEFIIRERAQELRPDVELVLDVVRPNAEGEDWSVQFERRVREIASRAVGHVKRGDPVFVRTSLGDRARADRNVGADPVLRFLALVDPVAEERLEEERARRRPGGKAARPQPGST